jgi:hypothetical protein
LFDTLSLHDALPICRIMMSSARVQWETKGVGNMATSQEQFIVNAKGKRTGVVLSLRQYQRLMEDLHDLAIVAERRKEKPIAFEALKQQLKKNGRL